MATMSFGEYLSVLVRRQGRTMATFASEAGVSPSTMSRIRTGKRSPTAQQLERWSALLKLDPEARATLDELALLERTPPEVRRRLEQVENAATTEQDKREALARDYGRYRHEQRYHDGWWLCYSHSFLDDGRIQRSLLRVAGGEAWMQVRESGRLHYSYHGAVEVLGDKIFMRLSEDRGAVEHVQITCDSLFDYREPSFQYGLVCGISGKDPRHPVSYPAAARILLIHVGNEHDLPADAPVIGKLETMLGSFPEAAVRPFWPAFLGSDAYLRQCLRLTTEPLDGAIARLIDNRGKAGQQVLRAVFV
ncbi:MAG: helix-turn-helix transcriptional regulator [Planctomycetes bacterium]|nr:helix-turn-helix transcriptional regulator [Planctomycetota bacterium]